MGLGLGEHHQLQNDSATIREACTEQRLKVRPQPRVRFGK